MSLISAQGKVDLTYMQDFTKPSPLTTVPIECERSALKNGTEILGPNNYPLESVQNTSISEDIKDSNSLKGIISEALWSDYTMCTTKLCTQ